MGYQAPSPPSWGQWRGQQQQPDYVMMDTSNMMSYDSRTTTSAPLQRSSYAPQYIPSTSYSMAPMTSMTTSSYQPSNFNFNSYTPPSPAPLVPSFRQYQDERTPMRLLPTNSPSPRPGDHFQPRDSRSTYLDEHSRVAVRTETQQQHSPMSTTGGSKPSSPKTDGAGIKEEEAVFNTEIDKMIRQIQSKKKKLDAQATSTASPEESSYPSPDGSKMGPNSRSASPDDLPVRGKQKRRHFCDWPGCSRRFMQKTHLEIHLRKHTGFKPYKCNAGCDRYFSQLGNLKTHERRHTGEKPYHCETCGKRFAQRGNLRAHWETHTGRKKFQCRLDTCTKDFGQLGNLKNHQNKFHQATFQRLQATLANTENLDDLPPDERQQCLDFAEIYKNSCKGIKGRGKHRKIEPIHQQTPVNKVHVPSQYPAQLPTPPMSHVPHLPMPHLPLPTQHGMAHPMHHSYHMPSRIVPRNYDMYDVGQDGMASDATSTPGTMYDEDHGRGLNFGNRLIY